MYGFCSLQMCLCALYFDFGSFIRSNIENVQVQREGLLLLQYFRQWHNKYKLVGPIPKANINIKLNAESNNRGRI